jgi:hypothetical protein
VSLLHGLAAGERDSFDPALFMGAQNQVGCLGNAPFFSDKWVTFRVPAKPATECTALKVDNSAKAGSIDPTAGQKTMDQHIGP